MTRPLPPTDPAGPRPRRPWREAGQASPLLAVTLVLAAVLVLALARGGSVAVDAARARTAADAAALAAAADGSDAADQVATANGAVLESVSQDGLDVVVRVRVGEAGAEARARQEGTWCPAHARVEAGPWPCVGRASSGGVLLVWSGSLFGVAARRRRRTRPLALQADTGPRPGTSYTAGSCRSSPG